MPCARLKPLPQGPAVPGVTLPTAQGMLAEATLWARAFPLLPSKPPSVDNSDITKRAAACASVSLLSHQREKGWDNSRGSLGSRRARGLVACGRALQSSPRFRPGAAARAAPCW